MSITDRNLKLIKKEDDILASQDIDYGDHNEYVEYDNENDE